MLRVFAEAAQRAVPVVRKSNVRVLRLGVARRDGERSDGTG